MRKVRLDAGRFFNRDPICENGGVNIYVFSNNSPVSFFEELGLKCIPEGNPRLLPNEDWHLQSVDFDFHNERGHIFLDGIKSNWRRKGIVNCCCNGQSVQKTVYRIHSQTYPFSSQTGGPIVTQTLNISGATDIPLPTSAHAALADLFGMFLNKSVTFPLGVDPDNIGRSKSGLKATAPNDSSGSWPENPCN